MDENCRDFAFVGANAWRVLEAEAGVTGRCPISHFSCRVDSSPKAFVLCWTFAGHNSVFFHLQASKLTTLTPLNGCFRPPKPTT